MEPINQKILKHRDLYENAGLEVPPYRITGIEHRLLRDFCLRTYPKKGDEIKQTLITNYHGVVIEHVMRLTDY